MAVFKCKMCGGSLEIDENQAVITCDYCGTQQTLPKIDDDKKLALFNRANNLRFKNEFDKAAGIYESIIAEFPDEAEAYWGLVLCKYGIEYVEDVSGCRIPTCHRTVPVAIMEDDDFQQACENADITAKNIYRDEAKSIDKIQKKILNIALNEAPYDIFICYKETDDITGLRTEDSLIAQDIYTQLLKDGYRVFFSRVTLREVAGTEYEPYIYAALSSAKIMLAIGTKHDYYDAVWVKNEWSRFISMMGEDSAKVLVPCFKNMDAYDMPKEFKNMQGLDMSDVTFFGSLIDNIKKVISKDVIKSVKETVVVNSNNSQPEPLLKRAYMFLEDEDWNTANEYCEKVLDIDPENARAYLGKLMAELKVKKIDDLINLSELFNNNPNYPKIIRFADADLKKQIIGYLNFIENRNKNARLENIYNKAEKFMAIGNASSFSRAAEMFKSISGFRDSDNLANECLKQIEILDKQTRYDTAKAVTKRNTEENYRAAAKMFESISGFRDSDNLAKECLEKAEVARKLTETKCKRRKIISISVPSVVALTLAIVILLNMVVIPKAKFSDIVGIAAGSDHTVGLKSDGTVVAVGDNYYDKCDVSNWTDIVAVSAGHYHTVGLKSDGTVVAVGDNDYGQCDVSEWTDIVAVSAGYDHTVGLKSDGTVVTAGDYYGEYAVSNWTDIVAVSAGYDYTVGLKSDGTVVAVGDSDDDRCDVSEWTDIVAISAGSVHTVGLKSDGTVVAIGGWNWYGQCDVSDWTDIVAISAGSSHTIGLKSDGTVVAVGDNDNGQCDVSEWTDIVAIFAGGWHTVGLKSDGTVVAVGHNDDGQCLVGGSK